MSVTAQQTALVTGGTSGIGRAICSALSERGYRVFGTGRFVESGTKLDDYTLVRLDVCDPESVARAVGFVTAEAGGIDILVNNAGIGMAGSVEDSLIEEIHEVFDVNVYGMVRMCQAVLPFMRRRGAGTIINVSSVGALMGLPYRGVYTASKAAVESISESLSQEAMRFDVKVVMVEPGDFRTNINEHRKVSASSHASVYADEFRRIHRVIQDEVTEGADPAVIGELVLRILGSSRPRLRYNVGNLTAKAGVALKFLLPDRWFEGLMMMHYGLKRHRATPAAWFPARKRLHR